MLFGEHGHAQVFGIEAGVQDSFASPAIGDVLLQGQVKAVVNADARSGFVGLAEGGDGGEGGDDQEGD